jgi:hypothetical protein
MGKVSKATAVRNITATATGVLNISIAMMVCEAGTVLGSRTHTVALEPGEDVEERLADVSRHISEEGQIFQAPTMLSGVGGIGTQSERVVYPSISERDIAKVRARASEEWTDEVLAYWNSKRAAKSGQRT